MVSYLTNMLSLKFQMTQLMMMHRTMESYKARHKAFQDRYNGIPSSKSENGSNQQLVGEMLNLTRESRLAHDLRLAHKFAPIWPVGSDNSYWWSGSTLTSQSFLGSRKLLLPAIFRQPINHLWSAWSPNPCTSSSVHKKNGE